jgi:superfamily II DNA or RNA helicase
MRRVTARPSRPTPVRPARLPELTLATTPRRYQSMALDAYAAARQAGRTRSYLVLPPGAGKTLVGLDVIRRERRRALVLAPNSAVQAQWLSQWAQHVNGTSGRATR